ncbi:protein preY, mitochondrial-like [Salarias fasciatus]|uniref:Protein preY, mitochondrial n=1 Tax=Salarias fasciatus TaxID=181472 RepID=A0A672HJF6_SALFA|nr:protein preY, mitochondrial-like [Salarias fasciatus]
MFKHVVGRLLTAPGAPGRCAAFPAVRPASARRLSGAKNEAPPPFDASLLDVLVCPLSKKPLRYEASTSELINEELGIAYPVVDGIPNMIPQEARLIQKTPDAPDAPEPQ